MRVRACVHVHERGRGRARARRRELAGCAARADEAQVALNEREREYSVVWPGCRPTWPATFFSSFFFVVAGRPFRRRFFPAGRNLLRGGGWRHREWGEWRSQPRQQLEQACRVHGGEGSDGRRRGGFGIKRESRWLDRGHVVGVGVGGGGGTGRRGASSCGVRRAEVIVVTLTVNWDCEDAVLVSDSRQRSKRSRRGFPAARGVHATKRLEKRMPLNEERHDGATPPPAGD